MERLPLLQKFIDRITLKPRWLGAFIILAVASVLILIVEYSFRAHQTASLLPPSAFDVDRLAAEQFLQTELLTRCAFLPVRLFTGWISFALVLYYTCVAFAPAQRIRFKQIFALEVHAEAILVFGTLVAAVYAMLSTPAEGTIPIVPLSAASFMPGINGLMLLFMNSVNLFQLLYVVALVYGIRQITGFGRVKSAFIVLIVWAVCAFTNIAMIKFVQERVHLLF